MCENRSVKKNTDRLDLTKAVCVFLQYITYGYIEIYIMGILCYSGACWLLLYFHFSCEKEVVVSRSDITDGIASTVTSVF